MFKATSSLFSLILFAAGMCSCQAPSGIGRGNVQGHRQSKLDRVWADSPAYRAYQATPPRIVKPLVSLYAPMPNYPPKLARGGYKGGVDVAFLVGKSGRVLDARVLESTDARFNDAALEAVRQATFSPARDAKGSIAIFATRRIIFSVAPPLVNPH